MNLLDTVNNNNNNKILMRNNIIEPIRAYALILFYLDLPYVILNKSFIKITKYK
jgi:hypothetical protein